VSDDSIEQLLSFASAPLGHAPSPNVDKIDGHHGSSLAAMLNRANGFYAFESALHVFPSGTTERMSVELWNDPDLWRHEYDDLTDGMTFFAEDAFGGQFVLTDTGISTFDPETGAAELIAEDLASWVHAILGDYEMLTGYPLAHAWQHRHGTLPEGRRLVPKLPFVTGGAYDIDNLDAADAVAGMRARGNLAVQIRDLPDGAKIHYRINE